jgi:hypothetical protein
MIYCYGDGYIYDEAPPEVVYDNGYSDKLDNYRENVIMHRVINTLRCEIVHRYGRQDKRVLDIGCGNMDFMNMYHAEYNPQIFGYDVIPKTVDNLKYVNAWIDIKDDSIAHIDVFTMWDVFEHIKIHDEILEKIPKYSYLIMSLPIFQDLNKIEESNHYRPGEHLWYFTHEGIKRYMENKGFMLIEHNNHETVAGRKQIKTYVFRGTV